MAGSGPGRAGHFEPTGPDRITRVDAIAGALPGMGLPSLKFPSIGSMDVERLVNGALKLDNLVFTAAALLAELQDADRREVEAVIGQFHLDRTRAPTSWLPGPTSGSCSRDRARSTTCPGTKKTAEVVMRYEQGHPGTLGLAAHGNASAIASIDSLIGESTAGVIDNPDSVVTERTSVFPALSTYSSRARGLVSNTPSKPGRPTI